VKLNVVVTSICLLFLLAFSALNQLGTAAVASEQTKTIDVRQMTFFDEMKTRNAEYVTSADWTLKVAPSDMPYLDSANDTVYAEIYVSDVDDTLQNAVDNKTGEIKHTLRVYTATEQAVNQLAEIPNTHFYVSMYSPSVCMTVQKQALQQIAKNPSVYCIRIIPPITPFLGISEIREMNDIAYTMANHDSTLDASTWIVVIGSGYDPNDSDFGGVANDNIMPNTSWDWTDSNTDVSNGNNWHETMITDALVKNFGDASVTDFSMYENRNFWTPLKIYDDDDNPISTQYALPAIEWCIAMDVDIVCMSWGAEPFLPWGINTCNSWWCDRFKAGTLQGITWVAAAGNGGHTNGVAYPAESHYVLGIGAYDNNPAQLLDMQDCKSSYGETHFRILLHPYGWGMCCSTCYEGRGANTEFKPNAYECGYLGYSAWGAGNSYSGALACADIAIGIYSPYGGEYTQGFTYLWNVIPYTCHEYMVSPTECSTQGDVLDTHSLWHRNMEQP